MNPEPAKWHLYDCGRDFVGLTHEVKINGYTLLVLCDIHPEEGEADIRTVVECPDGYWISEYDRHGITVDHALALTGKDHQWVYDNLTVPDGEPWD